MDFYDRYNKFSKNNLPTPYWDNERHTLEYVYFADGEAQVFDNITFALENIIYAGFYYSFTSRHLSGHLEGKKMVYETVVGHSHDHSFEGVVRALYDSPESFSISKEEEIYYSKQELDYLRHVQKYLLFLGLKDVTELHPPVSRYRNTKYNKYKNAIVHHLSTKHVEQIINKELNFVVKDFYPEYEKYMKEDFTHFEALIIDDNEDFRLLIEYVKEEIKRYKEVKKIYEIPDKKDEDKVLVTYLKVKEVFNNE